MIKYTRQNYAEPEPQAMPDLNTPPGDGSLGVMEGYDARILARRQAAGALVESQ